MSLDLSVLKKYGEIPRQIKPFLDKYKEVGESYDEIETVARYHREKVSSMSVKGDPKESIITEFTMTHNSVVGHFFSLHVFENLLTVYNLCQGYEMKNEFTPFLKKSDIEDKLITPYVIYYKDEEINDITKDTKFKIKTGVKKEDALGLFEGLLRKAIEYSLK